MKYSYCYIEAVAGPHASKRPILGIFTQQNDSIIYSKLKARIVLVQRDEGKRPRGPQPNEAIHLRRLTDLRRPLGIAIVGGLIVSQILTLYTTPVVYLYLDRLRLWAKRRRQGGAAAMPAE